MAGGGMSLEQQAVAILQILLTAFLSMLIGLEREHAGKNAGVRTYMLAGIGACIFTILSVYAFPGGDTSRIASNIVTGIGFLGAGMIVQRGESVSELTTAAGIWATAGIGMAVGTGAWLLAIGGTVTIWFVLEVVQRMRQRVKPQATNANQPNHHNP
jgi:putative Mg2+ transporter-C (MgtC) family protein